MASEARTVELQTIESSGGAFHTFTIKPALGRDTLAGLALPYTMRDTEYAFRSSTAHYAKWPYDHIVTETDKETILAISQDTLEHVREDSPVIVGEKLAWMLGASLTEREPKRL